MSTRTSPTSPVRASTLARTDWDWLIRDYGPQVLGWCRRFGLNEADAADTAQEVFHSAALNLPRFRTQASSGGANPPSDSFRAWLRTITRNKVFDHFRRCRRQPRPVGGMETQFDLAEIPEAESFDLDGEDEDRGSEGVGALRCRQAIDQIRGQFEPRTWQAFWRTTVDEQPASDVAAELAMSSGAVRVAKSRVLNRLREELQGVA